MGGAPARVLAVHHVDARDGEREDGAAAALQDEAAGAARALVGEVDAAALGDVALEAHKVVEPVLLVLFEHGLARPAGGEAARRADPREDAAARLRLAHVLHADRKLVRVIGVAEHVLVGLAAGAQAALAQGLDLVGRRVWAEEAHGRGASE